MGQTYEPDIQVVTSVLTLGDGSSAATQVSATSVKVYSVTFQLHDGASGTEAYQSTSSSTTTTNKDGHKFTKTQPLQIEMPMGIAKNLIDLSDIYIAGTNGDKVVMTIKRPRPAA